MHQAACPFPVPAREPCILLCSPAIMGLADSMAVWPHTVLGSVIAGARTRMWRSLQARWTLAAWSAGLCQLGHATALQGPEGMPGMALGLHCLILIVLHAKAQWRCGCACMTQASAW